MHCPLSSVHKSFALFRISLWRVGGDKGGDRVTFRRADFPLGTSKGLVRFCLWASGWGRHRGLPPRSRWCLRIAVVLRLRDGELWETMRNVCGSVVQSCRSSSLYAVRVGSCHGRRGWPMLKLHRLFSHFTVTRLSVKEPEIHNRKLLIRQGDSTNYHLQFYQIIHCGRGLVPRSSIHYD